MYIEEFLGFLLVFVIFVGIIWGIVAMAQHAENEDKKMRQDFTNCMEAHKEWVFKYDTGIDGQCVTKR